MKNLIMGIGAVFLCLLLAGCAGKSKEAQPEAQTTTITLASSKVYSDVMKNLIRSFEDENPDIRVNYVGMHGDLNKLYDIYTAPLNAEDETVDVFLLDNVWVPNFGAKNYVEQIEWPMEKQGMYEASMIKECTYEGRLISAPFSIDIDWIYYRQDLIEEPPDTWEGWIELGKQLVRDNRVQYGGVIQGKDGEEMLCTAREFIHSSDDAVQGLQLYKEVLNLGGEDVNLDSTTYVKAFSMGYAAFMKAGNAAWQVINSDSSEVKMKVGIAPLPSGRDSRPASLLGGSSLALNRHSQKKDASRRLIDYLTGEEAQTQAAVSYAIMPALRRVNDHYRVMEENKHFGFVKELGYDSFKRKGTSLSYLKRAEKVEKALEGFLTGAVSSQTAAAEINAFLN